MWHRGTGFSDGLGSVRLTVGLDDVESLFQPEQLYNFMRSQPQRTYFTWQKGSTDLRRGNDWAPVPDHQIGNKQK